MSLEATPQEVRIYETKERKRPYSEWLAELKDTQGRAVIRTRIGRVRNGNFGNCEPVGEGILELKIDFGPQFLPDRNKHDIDLVLLLCGGDKGSQDRDIKKAQEYWADYKRRGVYGEE